MTKDAAPSAVLLVVDEPLRGELTADLALEGADVIGAMSPSDAAAAVDRDDASFTTMLERADVLALRVDGDLLTASLIDRCDRAGARILALCRTADERRFAARFGTTVVDVDGIGALELLEAGRADPPEGGIDRRAGRVIAVWGPAGAPGRTTVAIEVAAELARLGRRVCLVDADSHAPAVALALGLPDEGPGLAAACRQAALGGLDEAELVRVSASVDLGGARIDVLSGINRPSRWPELGADRLRAVLDACRGWADDVVVDVASSIEADEEIVSDIGGDGPRRNAASRAVLGSADLVVAVAAADPLGMARFLRGHADIRAHLGSAGPAVHVVANRVRPGALGIDARGQIRRTLDRFAGIEAVWFLPHDPRSVDAAVLAARAVSAGSPRSPLVAAVRRFVGEAIERSGAASTPRRTRRGGRSRIGRRVDAA